MVFIFMMCSNFVLEFTQWNPFHEFDADFRWTFFLFFVEFFEHFQMSDIETLFFTDGAFVLQFIQCFNNVQQFIYIKYTSYIFFVVISTNSELCFKKLSIDDFSA